MATIQYTLANICPSGGHASFDISINAGPLRRLAFTTDQIRAPLADLTSEEREFLIATVLRIHMAGKTRAQIQTELQAGPVLVTI